MCLVAKERLYRSHDNEGTLQNPQVQPSACVGAEESQRYMRSGKKRNLNRLGNGRHASGLGVQCATSGLNNNMYLCFRNNNSEAYETKLSR